MARDGAGLGSGASDAPGAQTLQPEYRSELATQSITIKKGTSGILLAL